MKTLRIFSLLSLFIIFGSCKTDTVEEYFVNATENGDFFVTSIPSSIIQFDQDSLDAETIKELGSIKKINILLYQNSLDSAKKQEEYQKAHNAVQQQQYKTLTTFKDKAYEGTFSYLGSENKIDEILFIGKDNKSNFMIGILKGDGVHVNSMIKAMKHIKKFDKNQAKAIFGMLESKK